MNDDLDKIVARLGSLRRFKQAYEPTSAICRVLFEDAPALIVELRRMRNARDTLFAAIEHGDAEHKAWLSKKLEEHFK